MNLNPEIIKDNYLRVTEKISTAAIACGREPDRITLVVVSKSQPVEVVRSAMQAGVKILGENYPQEALEKIEAVGIQSGVEWHMIGHVQSRKAELVTQHFSMIHSLDSVKLAKRIDRFRNPSLGKLRVLVEFNIGDEASKTGIPAAAEEKWPELLDDLSSILALPNILVRGLMCMPPLGKEANNSRPYFQKTRKLQQFLKDQLPHGGWAELSMGTSLDYEIAIEEGATLVRVGTAILGARG